MLAKAYDRELDEDGYINKDMASEGDQKNPFLALERRQETEYRASKSLRRKPPPQAEEAVDEIEELEYFAQQYAPAYQGRAHQDVPRSQIEEAVPFFGDQGFRAGSLFHADKQAGIEQQLEGEGIDDVLCIDSSPRPMGPKSLPGVEQTLATPIRSPVGMIAERRLPYPSNESFFDTGLRSDSDEGDTMMEEFFSPTLRLGNRPDPSFYTAKQSDRKSELIHNSLSTPTRIPVLNRTSNLSAPRSEPKKYQPYGDTEFSHTKLSTARSLPSFPKKVERANLRVSTKNFSSRTGDRLSKDSPYPRSEPKIEVDDSSPIGSPLSRKWSSRSPSPTKHVNRSPSLVYEPFYISGDQDFNDEESTEYEKTNDDDYEKSFSNKTVWKPLDVQKFESIMRDRKNEEEEDDDDEDDDEVGDEDDTTMYSPAGHIDYSLLPSLPGSPSSAYSPTPPFNRKDSMDLGQTGESLQRMDSLSASIKRKKGALPPIPLELPTLPLSSGILVAQHLEACKKVWSLRSIYSWLYSLKESISLSALALSELKKIIMKLLLYHRRHIPWNVVDQNATQIIQSLFELNAIKSVTNGGVSEGEDANVEIIAVRNVNGVFSELINCYSYDKHHSLSSTVQKLKNLHLQCYSSQCYLDKVLRNEHRVRTTNMDMITFGPDWASHWKFTAEDLATFGKALSKKQSFIFDLLKHEENFIRRASCFVEVVVPEFLKTINLLIGAREIVKGLNLEHDILLPTSELVEKHKRVLFKPLLHIFIREGKFINDLCGITNIYRRWSEEIKKPLGKYISLMPLFEDLMQNDLVKNWMEVDIGHNERVRQLKVNGSLLFLSTFNSRYQHLPLQLNDIRMMTDELSPEHSSIGETIDTLKKMGKFLNAIKSEADNSYALRKLEGQLIWKKNIQVNLNLGSENRKILYRRDILKRGDLKINLTLNHVIVLDNYLLITEKVKNTKSQQYQYKVLEAPIPIEFLLLEIKEKNQSLTSSLKVNDSGSNIFSGGLSPIQLTLESQNDEMEPSSYPFKVKFAGRGKHHSYTFMSRSEKERSEWILHLTIAKGNLNKRLSKNQPYKLKIISNTTFAYPIHNRVEKLQVCSPSEAIEEACIDSMRYLEKLGYQRDIYSMDYHGKDFIYRKVLSAASFIYNGVTFYLLGLSSGFYCSDLKNEWMKVSDCTEITKISVLRSMRLVMVLANKRLRCFFLDLILQTYYGTKQTIASNLVLNEQISSYLVGAHRGLMVIFCIKKKSSASLSTEIVVLAPETENDGIFSGFRTIKRFYIQADCYKVTVLDKVFILHCNRQFEVLVLDKLSPRPIPDMPENESSPKRFDSFSKRSSSSYDHIKKLLNSTNARPLGFFQLLNGAEYLLVYSDFALFINKFGILSRTSVLLFQYRIRTVAFHENHLFLECEEAIEIWSISDFKNGTNKLIQLITGKDLNMICSDTAICVSMANPMVPGLQLVFQLCSA